MGRESHMLIDITEFSIPLRSEEDFARAVREGRCRPRFGFEQALAREQRELSCG